MNDTPEIVDRVAEAMHNASGLMVPWRGLVECGPETNNARYVAERRLWARASIEAHIAALTEAGFVIVPREPTPEMLEQAWAAALAEDAGEVWREMIDAAPK